MSVHATSWVLKNSSTKLGDRLVLISIADHADADGKDSRPSAIIIARDTRMSVRQVRRCLAKLVKEGRIVCTGITPSGTKIWDIDYDCPLDKNDVSYSGQIVRGDKLSGVTFKASGGVTNRVSRGDKSGIPYNKVEPSGTINNNHHIFVVSLQDFKDAYPKRVGGNDWPKVERKLAVLAKEKVDPAAILEGCRRYAKFCDATGATGTSFVRMPMTWLNNRNWEEAWEIPNDKGSLRKEFVATSLEELERSVR